MMFKVELNGKTYKVEKVTAKALREIGAAQAVFKRWQDNPDAADMKKDMDALVNWFCTFCGNQFTPDEYYDHYPADRAITDIGLAIAAVNAQVTHVLESFPTSGDSKKKAPSPTLFGRFTGRIWKKAGRLTK
jgi:hypothetical protein